MEEKCTPYWDAIVSNLEFQIICTIHLVKLRGSLGKLYDNGTNPSVHSSDLILRKLLTILRKCRQIGLQPYFGRNPIFSCDTDLFKSRNKGHTKHRKNGMALRFFPVLPVTYLCLKRVHQEWRTTLKSVIVKSKCRLFTRLAIQFRRLFLLSLQPKPSISGKNVKILCSEQLKSLENRIFGIKLVLSNYKEEKSSCP